MLLYLKIGNICRKNGFDITPNPMFVVGSENVSSSRNSTPSPASMVTNNIATNRTRHESITNAINENEKESGANNLHKAGSLISMTSQVCR